MDIKKLKNYLKKRKIPQYKFALLLDISPSYLSMILSGEREITEQLAHKIMLYTGGLL